MMGVHEMVKQVLDIPAEFKLQRGDLWGFQGGMEEQECQSALNG
jgi:hypothetical protein